MGTYTKFPELEEYLNDLSMHHFSHAGAFRQDAPSYIIRSLGYGAYESALDQIDEYAETLPEDEATELWDKAAELRQYVAKKTESKKTDKGRNLKESHLDGTAYLVDLLDEIIISKDPLWPDQAVILAGKAVAAIENGNYSKAIDCIDELAGEYLDKNWAEELWDAAAELRSISK